MLGLQNHKLQVIEKILKILKSWLEKALILV